MLRRKQSKHLRRTKNFLVKENAIEKKVPAALKDKGQYVFVFGVIALMLYATGFPVFLLFFVGALTFFIWKVFSMEGRYETRRIFEFYLSANEILREDDRRWYGFEIQETIGRGEQIIGSMSAAPPLVHFALGALYQKLDDHSSAIKHLSHVVEDTSTESAIVFPTKELREYVQMLRKIERAPAEAPLTSAAVRSLERSRKNKGKELLEYSRSQSAATAPQLTQKESRLESVVEMVSYREKDDACVDATDDGGDESHQQVANQMPLLFAGTVQRRQVIEHEKQSNRKSISEVLHDIYDENIQ